MKIEPTDGDIVGGGCRLVVVSEARHGWRLCGIHEEAWLVHRDGSCQMQFICPVNLACEAEWNQKVRCVMHAIRGQTHARKMTYAPVLLMRGRWPRGSSVPTVGGMLQLTLGAQLKMRWFGDFYKTPLLPLLVFPSRSLAISQRLQFVAFVHDAPRPCPLASMGMRD